MTKPSLTHTHKEARLYTPDLRMPLGQYCETDMTETEGKVI